MARTSATISVGGDTRQLERDIQKALVRDFKFKGLNEKALTQPLGRITGAANEFQKSLDASNARVIAFGASAGLIYSVERAFSALVKSTIDVQKSLTDINVILNVNNDTLQKFGNSLFDIAKNTAQSFDTVAQAATEFSRQGLTLEETLKRTRDALILTRLSGLDTVSAVEALTATINSFSETALDSTVIINKLANVDAAFAVSSADLADAIKRVGSSAQDAGVGFDELLAIVTSVQQTTARGGAVIGNSLKTIFTRIQRRDTLDQLEDLGIQVRDLEGNTLPAVQVLNNLASTFDKLSDVQRAQVAETVGGVFQINILKAALGDLNKEYSIYSRALETANSATDEAVIRNEALNQTLSALINKTFVNLTKLGADIGKISFQPTFENVLTLLNKGLESLSTDGAGIGNKIGKGIFEGLGAFISGPGVILITAVFGKLLLNLAKFASESLRTLLNVNTQAEQRAQIQAKINQVLSQEPNLIAAVYNKQISVLDVENKILSIIRQQTLERERAAALSTTIAGGLYRKGVTTKGGTLATKSEGFIPNFAMQEIFGALAGGYNPGNIRKINIPGEGQITYNTAEKVKKIKGFKQPAIMPPSSSRAGKNYQNQFESIHGFNPYASEGFIPNFAANPLQQAQRYVTEANRYKIDVEDLIKQRGYSVSPEVRKELDSIKTNPALFRRGGPKEIVSFPAQNLGIVGVTGRRGVINAQTSFSTLGYKNDPRIIRFEGIQARTLEDLKNTQINSKNAFSTEINRLFLDPLANLANSIFGPISTDSKFRSTLVSNTRKKGINLFPAGTEGSIFEAAVNLGTKKGGALEQAFNQDASQKPFDFEESSPPATAFNSKFRFNPPVIKADAKRTITPEQAREIIDKAYRDATTRPLLPDPKLKSSGFIPNFSALSDAIDRELSAGVSPNKIRIGRDKRLTSSFNPFGVGVYNTDDEPLGLSQGVARAGLRAKTAGASSGFIPSFANIPIAQPVGGIGMIKDEMALTKAIASTNRNMRVIDQATEKLGKNLDSLNGKFLGLSIALPILISTLTQFAEETPNTRAISNTLSNLTTFGFLGTALKGTKGGIAGIAAGTLLSTYQYIKDIEDTDIKLQVKQYEDLKQEFTDTQNGLQQLLPALEEYRKTELSSLDEISKTEALSQLRENILGTLQKIPEESTQKILEAFERGDLDKIPYLINESLFKRSAQLIETESKLFLDSLAKKGIQPGQEGDIAKILTGGRSARTGRTYFNELLEAPGGRETTQTIIKDLENILSNRESAVKEIEFLGKEAARRASDPSFQGIKPGTITGAIGENEGVIQAKITSEQSVEEAYKDFKDTFKIIKEGAINDFKQQGLLAFLGVTPQDTAKAAKAYLDTNNSLEDVLEAVKPIYQTSEEAQKYFEGILKNAENVDLTIEQEDKIIKQILADAKKRLIINKKTTKKQELVIRNLEEFENFYAKGTITDALIRDFGVRLDQSKEFNPRNVMGREYGKLFQGIRQEITNQSERNIISEKLIIGEQKLADQVNKRIIDEDQYLIALRELQQSSILLSKRQRGLLFAEDFRSGRQQAREDRILSNQMQLTDFSEAFFDEFDYNAKDAYREAQLGAIDTARTIKSEFNNAFFSFAQGTATASDAFRQMALNISNKIQQLALEFSTNLVFGQLFGSTSNIFGFGGGGGGIGKLFGFNKGGLIKGYSSGGTVTGGSGTKDDIPAMLTAGEYVIRKSAVKKYGPEYLQMLNEGKVSKKFVGGSVMQKITANNIQSIFAGIAGQIATQKSSVIGAPSANTFPGIVPNNRDRNSAYFKYGGRVQKFARGGEASFIGSNYFTSDFDAITIPETGQTLYRPKEGRVISEGLNIRAILDSSNPENEARKRAEDFYIKRINDIDQYLEYVDGVRKANEEAYKENQRINQEIRDQYNKQKSAASRGAWFQALFGLAGAGVSFANSGGGSMFGGQSKYGQSMALGAGSAARTNYLASSPLRYSAPVPRATGGYIKKFAKGGSSEDNVPALLMDGEFVMRKEAVNLYGKKFFDGLNQGRIKKFANGGETGGLNPQGLSNYMPTNNVNVTVNLNQQGQAQEQTETNSPEEQKQEAQRTKELAEKVKAQVMKVITEQQRPGGLLSSTIYKKIG